LFFIVLDCMQKKVEGVIGQPLMSLTLTMPFQKKDNI